MNTIENIFKYKSVDFNKLIPFGFTEEKDLFVYNRILPSSGFLLTVSINRSGELEAVVTDTELNEPYTLYLVKDAEGGFVGAVRAECERIFEEIAEQCYKSDVFKNDITKSIIAYVRTTYGDELEFLWEKFPDCAICRRQDNKKWYLLIMTVSKRKLGLNDDEITEIVNLRMKPELLDELADDRRYFHAYHMNKKHWVTVMLDGSVGFEELCERIDYSYTSAKK